LRVFATKVFARFARKERLEDKRLCEAITRAGHGAVDAELGGNVTSSAWRERAAGARAAIAR
jgi:hypothetical protein